MAFADSKAAKVTGDPKVAPGANFKDSVIRATGSGAPDLKAATPAQARLGAERAALADAFRNLLAQVKGTTVDGTHKVADMMEKDEVKLRVEGLVKGYKIVGKRYFSDGGVEIDIEVPMSAFADVIDPDPTPIVLVQAADPVKEPAKVADPAKKDPVAAAPKESERSTGLVIDARGLKVLPALAPRVLDDAGKPVYTIDSLSKEARKTSGVASYVQSLEEAQKSMKAGDKPLVVKASKATGADLTLGAEDAKKIIAANPTFLSEGKVVIVLN